MQYERRSCWTDMITFVSNWGHFAIMFLKCLSSAVQKWLLHVLFGNCTKVRVQSEISRMENNLFRKQILIKREVWTHTARAITMKQQLRLYLNRVELEDDYDCELEFRNKGPMILLVHYPTAWRNWENHEKRQSGQPGSRRTNTRQGCWSLNHVSQGQSTACAMSADIHWVGLLLQVACFFEKKIGILKLCPTVLTQGENNL
jgi:hypothetical protein